MTDKEKLKRIDALLKELYTPNLFTDESKASITTMQNFRFAIHDISNALHKKLNTEAYKKRQKEETRLFWDSWG